MRAVARTFAAVLLTGAVVGCSTGNSDQLRLVTSHSPSPTQVASSAAAAVSAPAPHSASAVASSASPAASGSVPPAAIAAGELPGGGQKIFPGRRFVALYGHPGAPSLGALGAQDVPASVARAKDLASQYQPLSSVPVIPTFEIIAAVAQGSAGNDGNYVGESTVESLRPWVKAATDAGMYVVLDIQPGLSDPLDLAKRYAPLLAQPNVGLALDPEWALAPGQVPLHQIGSLDSGVINRVGEWLDHFTVAHHLPQKLFVLHQFRLTMIGNEAKLRTMYGNLAVLIHMDGQGGQPNKNATWRSVVGAAPKGMPFGWKNFYKEDHPVLTPQQTMAHQPQPMMVSYQ